MRCPKCGTLDDKVIDSRLAKDGSSIRRRRLCLECEARFTTYEVLERNEMRLEKKDGRRELFDRAKLLGSITKACEKRPISMEDMERVAEEIHRELDSLNDAEVTSRQLGKLVMERLRTLDPVAYVRYASVYRQFQEVGDFIDEIQSLERRIADSPDQPVLFKS